MLRIMLAALAVALLAVAPAGAKLRDAGPFPGDLVGTDGKRHLVGFQPGAGTFAVDLRTGARRRLEVPAGCSPRSVGRTGVVFACNREPDAWVTGGVVDLATGEGRPLPRLRFEQVPNDYAAYARVGREWAEIAIGGYHYGSSVYLNLRSGEIRPREEIDRRVTHDLDRPELVRPMCRGLRQPLVVDEDSGVGLETGSLTVAGRWAAAETFTDRSGDYRGRLLLQRCGRRPQDLGRCGPYSCGALALDADGTLAWTESGFRGGPRSTIHIRSVRNGRPHLRVFARNGLWRPVFVDHRLYAVAGGRLVQISL